MLPRDRRRASTLVDRRRKLRPHLVNMPSLDARRGGGSSSAGGAARRRRAPSVEGGGGSASTSCRFTRSWHTSPAFAKASRISLARVVLSRSVNRPSAPATPTNKSPTRGGSTVFAAAPVAEILVTVKDALLMLRPQPSPGWRVRPRMSSSKRSGMAARAYASLWQLCHRAFVRCTRRRRLRSSSQQSCDIMCAHSRVRTAWRRTNGATYGRSSVLLASGLIRAGCMIRHSSPRARSGRWTIRWSSDC